MDFDKKISHIEIFEDKIEFWVNGNWVIRINNNSNILFNQDITIGQNELALNFIKIVEDTTKMMRKNETSKE